MGIKLPAHKSDHLLPSNAKLRLNGAVRQLSLPFPGVRLTLHLPRIHKDFFSLLCLVVYIRAVAYFCVYTPLEYTSFSDTASLKELLGLLSSAVTILTFKISLSSVRHNVQIAVTESC